MNRSLGNCGAVRLAARRHFGSTRLLSAAPRHLASQQTNAQGSIQGLVSAEAQQLLKNRFSSVGPPQLWDLFAAFKNFKTSHGAVLPKSDAAFRCPLERETAQRVLPLLQALEDALMLMRSESDALMQEMAKEDAEKALNGLADVLPSIEEMVHRRIDQCDAWHAVSQVWTLETLGRAGGVEAGIFARDLLDMYKRYAAHRGWGVEDVTELDTHGGRLRLEGENIYWALKHEIGTHRVQRVPVTDADGKMQTSTASVFLMPQPSPVSVDIEERDLHFEFVRGSGPGGQGMQSSSNACVLTHAPSGITIKVHQGRSALDNKQIALERLAQRLWRERNAASSQFQNSLLAKQWTSGERGERIRTYNFPQNRVTDHRTDQNYVLEHFLASGQLLEQVHEHLSTKERRDLLVESLDQSLAQMLREKEAL